MAPELVSVQKARLDPENRSTLAAIALGGNRPSQFGTPDQVIVSAIRDIHRDIGEIVAISRFYRTPAIPVGAGPDFINAAALVCTDLDGLSCLAALHDIESRHGRERSLRWGARTLDLDLIFFGDAIHPDEATVRRWIALDPKAQRNSAPDRLILPHPRLQDRGFVLIPLAEIAPGWRHPLGGLSVAEMLAALPDAEIRDIRPWT